MVPDYLTIAEASALISKRELSPVELVETKGVATTGHSKVLIDHVPQHDATSVRRLTEAGAIVLGKLATHEFAFGGPSFDLPWPPARNPWDTSRFTGGSIRGPAALCGLAGLKPSYGLISRAGILPLAFSLDHAGPMAWTAEDCAIMLGAMARHDPADPASANRPVPDYRAALSGDVKGLRIGLIRHFYERDNPANEAMREGIAAAVKVLEDLGCSVREVRLSPLAGWAACGILIMLAEGYAIHEANLRQRFVDYGEAFRGRMALAALISGGDHVQAVRRRRELAAEFAAAMADLDLVMTATAPSEAPAIEAVGKFAIFERPSLTMPFNVTGTPAMSVCCGYTSSGLPLAFQLAGKPFDEVTVIKLAHAYQKATRWRSIRPRLRS